MIGYLNSDCAIDTGLWNVERNLILFLGFIGMIGFEEDLVINLVLLQDIMEILLACIVINNRMATYTYDILVGYDWNLE